MKCSKCGMIAPDTDRFCEFCGTDLHPRRAYGASDRYHRYKRLQTAEKRAEEQRRLEEKGQKERKPPPKAAGKPAAGRESPQRRRSATKKIPARSVGKAVQKATVSKALRRLSGPVRAALVGLCGLVVVVLATTYTWNYAVGYSSPHQLVMDFDRTVRAGEYKSANSLASGSLRVELMDVISKAHLTETYPYHTIRLDDGTKTIEYDEFLIDLECSMGKWTLTVRKGPAAGSEIWDDAPY